MAQTLDKCNICGWIGDSDDVIETEDGDWICPACGSTDVDDVNENPYEEEDDDFEGLFN
jgi:hypothetical protein